MKPQNSPYPARVSTSRTLALAAGFRTVVGAATSLVSPWSEHGELWSTITATELYPDVDPELLPDLLPLTRSLALSVPPIAKARHVIVTAISPLPLVAEVPRAQLPQLFRQLDPGRPNVVTLALVVDALFFYGRAWLLKVGRETMTDRPLALRFVDELDLDLDPETHMPTRIRSTGRAVTLDDLVLVEGVHPGVLAPSAGLTIRRARRADSAAARAMDNPVPSVELHQTMGDALPDAEVDALIKRWADARRGRNGGVAYTSPAIEAKMHGQAPEQLLINGRNATAVDCARVAGVPAWAVDASTSGSSLTYSNVPSRSRELLDYCLRGYLSAIAGRLSLDDVTPHGQAFRFDVRPLLQGDFGERMTAGKAAVEAGIYSPEEIRAIDPDTPSSPTPTPSSSTEQETTA